MFTGEGMEEFYIRAEAKKGTPLEKMEELLGSVEKLVEEIPKADLDSYRTYIGSISNEHGFDPNAKNGSHLEQLTVYLTPLQQRERAPWEGFRSKNCQRGCASRADGQLPTISLNSSASKARRVSGWTAPVAESSAR